MISADGRSGKCGNSGETTQVLGAGWREVTGRRSQKLGFCEGKKVVGVYGGSFIPGRGSSPVPLPGK